MTPTETARTILQRTRTIALVGASDKPYRDSYRILAYLVNAGFSVYPVNPNLESVQGLACVASVRDLTSSVDTVVCFRQSELILPIAQDAIAAGVHHLWMQLGVTNESARECAEQAGLLVVMNRCIMVDHLRWVRAT